MSHRVWIATLVALVSAPAPGAPLGRPAADDAGRGERADARVPGEDVPVRRVSTTSARNGQLAFSPDGESIAFVSNRDGSWQLYRMTSKGADVRQLTHVEEPVGWPSWTSDGAEILFYAGSEHYRIHAVGVDGGPVDVLFDEGVHDLRPEISPDGERILFDSVALDADGPWHQIWVMEADGSERRRLTTGRAYHSDARWAPDGEWIVYQSGEHGSPDDPLAIIEIRIMRADGTGGRRVTWDGARNTYPTFSPDGTRIAFTKEHGDNADIWVVGVDGGEPRRMTFHPGVDTTPCWSPDGTRLYFSSSRGGESEDVFYLELDEDSERSRSTDGG